MKHIRFKALIIEVIFLLLATVAVAQVNPGDADNNGVVDNHDILYVGYAFGTIGPKRIEVEAQGDTSLPVILYWEENFPTGQNYIFADVDGSGIVDWEDFLQVYNNYGVVYHELRETSYPAGLPLTDPLLDLQLGDMANVITEGSTIKLPLKLGDVMRPINEFNGLAFSIDFDSSYIKEIRLDIDSTSWLRANDQLFTFQTLPHEREGAMDVALTRLGQNPVSGFGEIGTLSIIIEDDLVDFKPFEKDSIHTFIFLNGIELLDVDFNRVPLAGRGLKLNIVNPRLLSPIDPLPDIHVDVYPNPVSNWLQVDSPLPIQDIELWDTQGHLLFEKRACFGKNYRLSLPDLPAGILILKVFTERGIITKKIFHISRHNN